MKTTATYTDGYKEQALAKVYTRGDRMIQALAEELNSRVFTLKNWLKLTSPDPKNRLSQPAKRPQDWQPEQRRSALQETSGLVGEAWKAGCRGTADICSSMDRREG